MSKSNLKREFGAAVRAHRLRLGLSQESLAERADLHRTYVTDVERGARNISLESISRLAQGLDLSIGSLFSARLSENTQVSVAVDVSQDGAQIVLVEDDPKDIELTLAAFANAHLLNPVEVIRDGEAALDFLLHQAANRNRPQLLRPPVVLLDLHLPKTHGLEVLRRLRGEERTRTVQVVVLTNSHRDWDVREALRLGADAYIVKPLDFHALASIAPQLNFSWVLMRDNNTQKIPLSTRQRT